MKIEVYAVCYNEALLLPYFLRYYSQFADIFIFDNYSTDNSVKIAQDRGAHVTMWDTGGEMREDLMYALKSNCWRESKADWVIVGDIDEFVYHKDMLKILKTTQGTVIMPRTFNMYSDKFPTTKGQIFEEVNMGADGQGKMNLFKPSEIKEINYDAGCHNANPIGNFVLNVNSEILTLHFRFLSPEYVIWKNFGTAIRQSESDRNNGWNWHFATPAEQIISNFRDTKPRLIKIV
jgi:hypothetical protein